MKGFKAFDKDFKCRGFQFEVGKEYKEKDAIICEKGFHFCENPLDVLDYYDLANCTFAEVEAGGKIVDHDYDSKHAATKIKINAKLSLAGFIKTSVDFLLSITKEDKSINAASGDSSQLAASGYSSKLASSGDSSQLASSGYYSQLAASGDSSQLAASGYSSQLASSGDSSQLASSGYSSKLASSGYYSKLASSGDSSQLAASGYSSKLASSGDSSQLAASGDSSKLDMTGEDSVGAAIGINNTIKGKIGDWITLAEWKYDTNKKRNVPVFVKSAKIDGKKIKADTWYKLRDKKFVEA